MFGRLKERLNDGDTLIGTFVKTPAINLVEILGFVGFDFIIIDMEHSSLDFAQAEALVVAAASVGLGSVIRTAKNQDDLIVKALDLGCDGVQIPLIETAAQAKAAVRSAHYFPLGDRSISFSTRAAAYGTIPPPEYVEKSNQKQMVILQVENRGAVECSAALSKVQGADVLFLGTADLCQSMGYPGHLLLDEIEKSLSLMSASVKAMDKWMGAFVGSERDLKIAIRYRIPYLVFSTDLGLFQKGAKSELQMIRGFLEN